MKRLLFIIVIIMAMCMPVQALTYNASDPATFNNGYAWGGHPQKDRAQIWAQDLQAIAEAGSQLGTGNIRYVDSGRSASGDGTSWSRAFITLEEAFAATAANALTANNGDIVLVAQGHAENLSAADGVDCDVAGVTVIGMGRGTDAPEFTYTAIPGEFVIGAANVTIYNLRFIAATDIITLAVSVEAGGDNFTMIGCEFPEPTVAADEFLDAIDLAALAHGFRIYNCIYRHTSTTGPAHFIEAGNGANNNMRIVGNDIQGEFSVAAIWSDTSDVDAYIAYNTVKNQTSGQYAIEFAQGVVPATGMLVYNNVFTDASATSIGNGGMYLYENYVTIASNTNAWSYPGINTYKP